MFNKKSLMFLIISLISILIVGCASEAGDASGNSEESMENVVAKVNGNSISTVEYEDLVQMMVSSYESQGVDFTTEEGEKFLEQIKSQAVNSLVQEEVLLQEAKANGFNASDETVDKQIEAVKSQFPSEEDFKTQLNNQNLTEDDYKKMIAKEIIIGEFLESEVKETPVSEEELQSVYDQYIEQISQQAGEAAEVPSFEDVKDQLEMQLTQQNQQEQVTKIIEVLLEENEIEIYI